VAPSRGSVPNGMDHLVAQEFCDRLQYALRIFERFSKPLLVVSGWDSSFIRSNPKAAAIMMARAAGGCQYKGNPEMVMSGVEEQWLETYNATLIECQDITYDRNRTCLLRDFGFSVKEASWENDPMTIELVECSGGVAAHDCDIVITGRGVRGHPTRAPHIARLRGLDVFLQGVSDPTNGWSSRQQGIAEFPVEEPICFPEHDPCMLSDWGAAVPNEWEDADWTTTPADWDSATPATNAARPEVDRPMDGVSNMHVPPLSALIIEPEGEQTSEDILLEARLTIMDRVHSCSSPLRVAWMLDHFLFLKLKDELVAEGTSSYGRDLDIVTIGHQGIEAFVPERGSQRSIYVIAHSYASGDVPKADLHFSARNLELPEEGDRYTLRQFMRDSAGAQTLLDEMAETIASRLSGQDRTFRVAVGCEDGSRSGAFAEVAMVKLQEILKADGFEGWKVRYELPAPTLTSKEPRGGKKKPSRTQRR